MKGKGVLLFLILITHLLLFSRAIPVQAQSPESKKTESVVVEKEEVIDRDFFAAGDSVIISGVVNGDVFAAGANILVDGKVNGDLLVGGGTVTLLGEVSDDVRVGGGIVLINGIIGKNLTVGGGNVNITKESKIGGSLLAFCGNIDVNGPIGREANVFAGRALFGNQIGGDLKGSFEKIVLTSEAQILGDLEYQSEEKAEFVKSATVSGKITYKPGGKKVPSLSKFASLKKIPSAISRPSRGRPSFKIFNFIISLALGLIFINLFPQRAERVVKTLESRSWTSLGVGILTPIIFGLVMILLAVTIIGIPLVILLSFLFVFLVYFSKIFAVLCTGKKILHSLNWNNGQTRALFVGLLVYYLLRIISVTSFLTAFVFTAFGLGAFFLDQKSHFQASRSKNLEK